VSDEGLRSLGVRCDESQASISPEEPWQERQSDRRDIAPQSTPMRLTSGILHGFVAWTIMTLARLLPGLLRRALEREAVLAACRMYELGGGIDDGAAALVGSWGAAGHEIVLRLLAANRIPRKHVFTAELFLRVAPES
jgi:hypothetical protein